jgi:ferredoxin
MEVPVKVTVDREMCAGHGQCNAAAPEVFELNDDGYVLKDVTDVPEGMEEAASRGIAACPERALRATEDVGA